MGRANTMQCINPYLSPASLVYYPINNLPCVIPSEAKESRFEIATSHTLLAMTMYRSVRDRTLEVQK